MKRHYDIVYLTNTPSFYKLNLCNEIAKRRPILLVFYGYGSEAVNTVLDGKSWNFDYEFINIGDSNKRNKFFSFVKLCILMRKIYAYKIIFAGWLSIEYNLFSFFSPKHKNVMVCESSILDVSFDGILGRLKKLIINRMSAVLPSGTPHKELFNSIKFRGESFITGSVGIFNKKDKLQKDKAHCPLKYLYVGRLVEVKNVSLLIDVFNKNGLPLTIVGEGALSSELKSHAGENIKFTGFIENEKLGEIYSAHDVFILPSTYEPWGLVVEEALFRGLPVIVSDKVGCGYDLVKRLNTGLIFKLNDIASINEAIVKISENYSYYSTNVDLIDWEKRNQQQIDAYLEILKS